MASNSNQRTVQRSSSSDEFIDLTEGLALENVLFENIPDQYVKKENITVFFNIIDDSQINPKKDKIGLKMVGFPKASDSLVFAPVEIASGTLSGTSRYGTATFYTSTLPSNDDEFYQFCYVLENDRILGSSIPFQLNFSGDQIELKENLTPDILGVDKLRQEKQQLYDANRRLESENHDLKRELNTRGNGQGEQVTQLKENIEALIGEKSKITAQLEGLQEREAQLIKDFEDSQKLCERYKSESDENGAKRGELETVQAGLTAELEKVRAQLLVASQTVKDQENKIIDLQNRLVRADEVNSQSMQRQTQLEQQLRDFHLTADKTKRSIEGKFQSQTQEMEKANASLKELQDENESLKNQVQDLQQENETLQGSVEDVKTKLQAVTEAQKAEKEASEKEIVELQTRLREELKESRGKIVDEQESTQILKISIKQLKERCLKHQKNEMESKKQLVTYQSMVDGLQKEINDLTKRLDESANDYKELHDKYRELQRTSRLEAEKAALSAERPPQRPVERPPQRPAERPSAPTASGGSGTPPRTKTDPQDDLLGGRSGKSTGTVPKGDGEIKVCPVCNAVFPPEAPLKDKHQHIENHFGGK